MKYVIFLASVEDSYFKRQAQKRDFLDFLLRWVCKYIFRRMEGHGKDVSKQPFHDYHKGLQCNPDLVLL